VRAPRPAGDGALVHDIGRYTMSVWPWIEGTTHPFGHYPDDELRDDVLRVLAALHAATPTVEAVAAVETFALADRDALEAALADLANPWTTGPFAEAAREILAAEPQHIRDALAAYDDLAKRAGAAPRVITHGEPHAANVIVTADGPVLIDWDTTLLAPLERDLACVVGIDADEAGAYVDAGVEPPDIDRLLLYSLCWDLKDLASYTAVLRRPHVENEDTAKMLEGLAFSSAFGEHFPGLID
jgi:aminoglycoside phosphotransferase (APT) family kinase protein